MPPQSLRLNTGQEIPAVGFGTWQAPPGEVARAVETAIKAGYRLIDAAYCYQNETEVGAGIAATISAGIVKREDLFVMTKLWTTYSSRASLGLEKSLANLGLEYVDLYMVHFPVGLNPNGNHDVFPRLEDGVTRDVVWDHDHLQTWRDMEALPETGKTKAIGVSNYSPPYLKKLLKHARIVPAINQTERHHMLPQEDVVELCRENGIHVVVYSPLGSTGSPMMKLDPVVKIAEKKGVSPATVLLSWHVNDGHTVLAKSVTESRIKENLTITDLDADDIELLKSYPKESGNLKRLNSPPYNIDLGFVDNPGGRIMAHGADQ